MSIDKQRRRAALRRLAVSGALLALGSGGCQPAPASSPASATASGSPAASATATGAQPSGSTLGSGSPSNTASTAARELPVGGLGAGTYEASEFAAPFTVTLDGDPLWTVQWATPHLVNMGALQGEMQIFVSPEVHKEGRQDALIPAPEDPIAWLRSVPGLEVIETIPTRIGNLPATEIRMRPTGSRSVFLIPELDADEPDRQPYGFSLNVGDPEAAGGFATWYLVDHPTDEGPLWVTYYTENPEFLPALDELLAALRFTET